MTAFATSRRHEAEQQECLAKPHLTHTAAVSKPTSHSASEKLANRLRKMASLQSTSRRIVALPALPGIGPARSATSSPSIEPPSSALSNPSTGLTLNQPLARKANLSSVEKAAIEAERVKLDRRAAEKEWAEYLAAGTVSVTDGLNLVRFWDVSSLILVILLQMNLPYLKVNEQAYSLMFPVAVDILPVQASSVPCE
jgi:hypothetical protein